MINLIDSQLPELLTPNFSTLQSPLIPVPINGLDALEDIYCVGLQPIDRWRSYIDATNWDPKIYHDKLLQKRAYHARIVWEMLTLESFTDSTWLSTASVQMIRDVAYLELRQTEVEMMSYQLTCGMIGISVDKAKSNDLYYCALTLYCTILWLCDKAQGKTKTKKQHEAYSDVVREMKPNRSDSPKENGKAIDKLIFAVQEFLKRSTIMLDNEKEKEEFMNELSLKLKKCIISFDKVAIIL